MATFSYAGNVKSLSSGYVEESETFSYDESAVVGLDSIDYGFIVEGNTFYDDYGLVTDATNYAYQRIDYEFLTPNVTIKPFGSIGNITEFADVSLVRNSVGGIVFLMYGSSITSIKPLIFGGGSFLARGDAAIAFSPQIVGSGILFEFSSSAVTKTTKQDGAGLFKFISTTSHSFTPASHIGAGSLFGFLSTTESYAPNPPESTILFKITGAASNEQRAYGYNGTGRIFSIGGLAERVAYAYSESSTVLLDFDDYGFIGESPIFDDDYLTITYNDLNRPWNFDDYGFIIDNETRLPFGLFNIESATEIAFTPSNVTTGTITVFGEAKVYVLPIHLGSGTFKVQGSADPAASLLHIGSGKFSLISGTAESVGPNPPVSTALFDINGSASQAQSPAIFGQGFFKKIGGSAEALSSNPPESTILFKITGAATNEQRAFGYNGTGRLFPISGMAERVAYAYNESSTVLLDFDDYGFIGESPVSVRDDDLISNNNIAPGISEDYGFLTPNASNLPFGPFNISATAGQVFTPSHVTTGRLKISGDAKIYILPLVIGRGVIKLIGDTRNVQSPAILGRGSLFGFDGAAEATSPQIATETALFKISGRATESTTPATHVGTGSLFTFVSSTESSGFNPSESIALFKITGAASNEQRAYGYNGTGSLFTIDGHVERVSYAYNESSIVTPDCLDYGFISAAPDYVPDPEEDYGLIANLDIRLPWQKNDYGLITDFETRLPYGVFDVGGSAQTPYSAIVVGDPTPLKLFGESEVYVTPIHLGSGNISVRGTSGDPTITLKYIGSGSLFTFISKTESTAVSPDDTKVLFSISGDAQITPVIRHSGTGSISLGKSSPGMPGDGSRATTIFKLKHFGSGSLFGFSSTTESLIVDPPEKDQTTLFTFSGSSVNSRTHTYSTKITGIGSLRISGAAGDEQRAFGYSGTGSISLGKSSPGMPGDGSRATTIFKLKHFGSGQFSAITGAAEATGSNPPDQTLLFTFAGFSTSSETTKVPQTTIETKIFGTAIERHTESYAGSGSLFGFSSTTESTAVSPDDTKVLFSISGIGSESVTPAPHIGSGSLFTFISKTESLVVNPPDQTLLFTFTGSAIERHTESYVGSGSLFGFSSTTESRSVSPDSTGLFRFFGKSVEKHTEAYVGTGSLFGFSSTTESTAVSPDDTKVLFSISGNATESSIPAPHIGSGSLFTFISKTESTAVSPDDTKVLFSISGSVIERLTKSYAGSGSLFGFSSTTESIAVSPDDTGTLFTFFGTAANSIAPAPHIGSGSLFTFISKTESTAVSPDDTKVLFSISGDAVVNRTASHAGSGSLFGFSSTTESTAVSPDDTKVLFRITSGTRESFARSNYNGHVLVDIDGAVSNHQYVTFVAPRKPRIYVI